MKFGIKAISAALAFGLAAATAAPVAAQERIEVGVLTCFVAGGTGFVFGSSKALDCSFRHVAGRLEAYTGEINKFGIDIGTTTRSTIVWAVLAPTRDIPPGALAGKYGGLSAEATAGVGLGASAMVGGFDNSIALQPFSVQAQEGLNFAAGIGGVELRVQ